jgi:hypothetical protein
MEKAYQEDEYDSQMEEEKSQEKYRPFQDENNDIEMEDEES